MSGGGSFAFTISIPFELRSAAPAWLTCRHPYVREWSDGWVWCPACQRWGMRGRRTDVVLSWRDPDCRPYVSRRYVVEPSRFHGVSAAHTL